MKLLDSQAPVEGTEFAPEAEALFREARKRERRRRFGAALAVLLVAGGAGAAVAIIGGGAGRTVQTTVSSPLERGGRRSTARPSHTRACSRSCQMVLSTF